MESNGSPEIPDRGEISDIPGLPSGGGGHRERERERTQITHIHTHTRARAHLRANTHTHTLIRGVNHTIGPSKVFSIRYMINY